MMRRRVFIAGLGGAAAWPLAARAQQRALPIIGFLNENRRSDGNWILPGFRQGLREFGFIEGQNVAVEYRWAEYDSDRLSGLATELVRDQVSVIVAAASDLAIGGAKAATEIIPIVFLSGPDPVRIGLVASLNRPGGNLTGVTLLSADLAPKRLGLLHDLVPQATVIALLLDGRFETQTSPDFQLRELESAGRNVGLRIIGVRVRSNDDFDAAFATAIGLGADALLVSSGSFFISHRDHLVALAANHRLPAIYQTREYAAAGGLMSYGPSLSDAFRQVGAYTGRILKGEKAADLPVIQPTKLELVINLKTAKTLGLEIPANLLALADEVIE
jgi:putative tryptophan/tyrosine transport system substrate-binding protein